MQRGSGLRFFRHLIFLVLFNIMFFVIGGAEHPVSVWLSYGFIHLAYLILVLTPRMIREGKSAIVYGLSIFTFSTIYFVMAFVVGFIFILVSPEGFRAALLVQLSILGLYGIVLISFLLSNERTAVAEENRQHEVECIKQASEQLKGLLVRIQDSTTKRKVEKVYDVLYSSPIKSHPEISQMEIGILSMVGELERAVARENNEHILSLSESLLTKINDRNSRLRTLN